MSNILLFKQKKDININQTKLLFAHPQFKIKAQFIIAKSWFGQFGKIN